MDMPGDHCDNAAEIGVAELSHPPASVAESLHDDLYRCWRHGMHLRQTVDQFTVSFRHLSNPLI
jgi:hypothetical protein